MSENNIPVKSVPKKKIMIAVCAVVAACLVLCIAGYLIWRNSLPVLELVDFPKEYTETCELGAVYSLKTTVTDVDGNEYRIAADVKTVSGEPVGVFGKNFDVADMEGYIVEYVAKIPGSRTQRSKLTLMVEDKTEPNVRINVPDTA